jgi:hypothetical protein
MDEARVYFHLGSTEVWTPYALPVAKLVPNPGRPVPFQSKLRGIKLFLGMMRNNNAKGKMVLCRNAVKMPLIRHLVIDKGIVLK